MSCVVCCHMQVVSFVQLRDVVDVDWRNEANAAKLKKTPKTYFIIRSELSNRRLYVCYVLRRLNFHGSVFVDLVF